MYKIFTTIILAISISFIASAQERSHTKSKVRIAPVNLTQKEKQVINLYKNVVPTVVTILTKSSKFSENGATENQGLGSGVIISNESHILTAAHVVEGSSEIYVKAADGIRRRATVLLSEKKADIALLKLNVPDSSLPHATLGDSDKLAVGQQVYAIGSPYGLENSFSSGIISAFRDFDDLYDGTVGLEFIQTDAAINSGNSGGPIFNSDGKVIGIASSILTVSGGFQGIGMVVSINTAKDILTFEDRPWIGVDGTLLSKEEFKKLFNLNIESGVLVQNIAKNSPAEKAGLRGGDVYAKINNKEVLLGGDIILKIGNQLACHVECLSRAKNKFNDKTKVEVLYLRGGEEHIAVLDISEARKNFLTLN